MRKLKIPASEVKYIGLEPTWNGPASSTEMIHAYTWYRSVIEAKDSRDLVEDYMHWKSYSASDIEIISYIEDAWFEVSNIPALCRMAMRGLHLSENQAKLLDSVIPGLVVRALERKAEKDVVRRPKPKPQEPQQSNAVIDVLSKVELSFDKAELIDVTGLLKMHSPKPADLKQESNRFEWLIEEVKHALERTDMACVECYRNHSKKQLRELLARYSGVLQAINLYCSTSIKPPTARKAKPKTPEKLVAKLRYLKSYQELGLISIDPKSIIGASEVILYNVTKRIIQRYVAPLGSKLSVYRSTIDGYDPGLSAKKKLRKPEIELPKFLVGGGKSVSKTFESVSTKASEVNGTVNSQTMVLRAIK